MTPAAAFLPADRDLLLALLRLPTVGPLESEPADAPPRLWDAQHAYAAAAGRLGFVPVHHAAARPEQVLRDDVPLAVRHAVDRTPGFLEAQPSLVLQLGPRLPLDATVMFNVHLDTVSGSPDVRFDGACFRGRGAIDAKGPATALLAGIRAAIAAEPAIGTDVGVLIQAVSGEEGGAMGTIGTRPLVERGFVGRLNVFCEPTGLRYLPRATAAMTARVSIDGRGSTDDRPESGHNATVLLGFLAAHLALELPRRAGAAGVCIAGLETGRLHNRVYGSGSLLVNISYASAAAGRRVEETFTAVLNDGLTRFAKRFADAPGFALTAADAASVTSLDWLKRRLPTLASADPWCESLLEDDAGLERWPDDEPAFTCDAIWMAGVPGTATIVLGPGDLAANHAHADQEFAAERDLAAFAEQIARVLVAFASATGRPAGMRTPQGGPQPGASQVTVKNAASRPDATGAAGASPPQDILVDDGQLVAFVAAVFGQRGLPPGRAHTAADALCYGDRTGHASHGLANLSRLYLPLFDQGRIDPRAEPRVVADRRAAVLLDGARALGLWAAAEAMDLAVERAAANGIGMVSVRGATHLGCAGHHALRAVARDMIGVVASNCGGQRIARPPGGRVAMLGTNPISVAAPAGDEHPFVLDMSTTATPTGRIRAAARAGAPIIEGWLEDDRGRPITDPAAFDRGEAHLLWLGGGGPGAYKGFGLGIVVEILAALVSGAALGPTPQALDGDGRPSGRDDDIGCVFIAIGPGLLRPIVNVRRDAQTLFGSLLACPPVDDSAPVRYPGWHEAERSLASRRDGVPIARALYDELGQIAETLRLPMPRPRDA